MIYEYYNYRSLLVYKLLRIFIFFFLRQSPEFWQRSSLLNLHMSTLLRNLVRNHPLLHLLLHHLRHNQRKNHRSLLIQKLAYFKSTLMAKDLHKRMNHQRSHLQLHFKGCHRVLIGLVLEQRTNRHLKSYVNLLIYLNSILNRLQI